MDINKLIKDKGLHITITQNKQGGNPPRITDDNGYSDLIWSCWGNKMGMTDSDGYLVYIPKSLVGKGK